MTGSTISYRYATQLRDQARTAYRQHDYDRAFELICRCQETDPTRAGEWAEAMKAIIAAAPSQETAETIKAGRRKDVIRCHCGTHFTRPHGNTSTQCLNCQTRKRLRQAGIHPDDPAHHQLTTHNQTARGRRPAP